MKRLTALAAIALFCVSFILQGVALGHHHDGHADDHAHHEHCLCVYVDKVEWSIDASLIAPCLHAPSTPTDQVAGITLLPNRIAVKKARAPPPL